MKHEEKDFDAVKLMRSLRDNLSEQMKNLNFAEQKRFVAERIKSAAEKDKSADNNMQVA